MSLCYSSRLISMILGSRLSRVPSTLISVKLQEYGASASPIRGSPCAGMSNLIGIAAACKPTCLEGVLYDGNTIAHMHPLQTDITMSSKSEHWSDYKWMSAVPD